MRLKKLSKEEQEVILKRITLKAENELEKINLENLWIIEPQVTTAKIKATQCNLTGSCYTKKR